MDAFVNLFLSEREYDLLELLTLSHKMYNVYSSLSTKSKHVKHLDFDKKRKSSKANL